MNGGPRIRRLQTPTAGVAAEFLAGLNGYERSGGLGPSTWRVSELLSALGDPHRRYPVIHVTGTNGKGSTTAMTAGLLRAAGWRVGSYMSPHVRRLGERVMIDGHPASDRAMSNAIARVARAAAYTGITPTWFEAITAAGLWLLAARAVDVAVIEVGMLGRWDATNVVDGDVAVVTNVQLDHTDLAGPTRAAIATEKAGIVKPGATLVLGERDPELRPIFEAQGPARTLASGAQLTWRNRHATATGSVVDLINPWGVRAGIHIDLIGRHQCDNALVALSAVEAFTGAALPAPLVERALRAVRVPGRFEIVGRNPTLVLDGAHNAAAAGALRDAVNETFPDAGPRVLVCGMVTGRDPIEFLQSVGAGEFGLVVATEPGSPRAVPAANLVDAAGTLGVSAVSIPLPARALATAVSAAGEHGLVVASGSLYLIDGVRMAGQATALAPDRRRHAGDLEPQLPPRGQHSTWPPSGVGIRTRETVHP